MTSFDLQSDRVITLYKKYYVETLSLFGSLLRGDSNSESDIDLLVSFSRPVSLLHLVALERELSAVLNARVDLVTKDSISPYLRKQILRERKEVYAA
jgi:predicted nucleotidyltransferase